MLLTGERRGHPEIPDQLLSQAHFAERQRIHPRWTWDHGTHELASIAPMLHDALPAGSHRIGARPPGNGPFYVPDWSLGAAGTPEYREHERLLKRLGFRPAVAQVCRVSPEGAFLETVMRLAQRHRWTASAPAGRLYLYPRLRGGARSALRDYTPELASPSSES